MPALCEFAVQRIGKVLAVGVAEGGRAAGVDAAAAQLFHESLNKTLSSL